jgi:hypothetical protein
MAREALVGLECAGQTLVAHVGPIANRAQVVTIYAGVSPGKGRSRAISSALAPLQCKVRNALQAARARAAGEASVPAAPAQSLQVDEGPRQARALLGGREFGVELAGEALLLILTGVTEPQAGQAETPQPEIARCCTGNTGGSASLVETVAATPGPKH